MNSTITSNCDQNFNFVDDYIGISNRYMFNCFIRIRYQEFNTQSRNVAILYIFQLQFRVSYYFLFSAVYLYVNVGLFL